MPMSTARSVRSSSQSIRSSANAATLRVAPELADPVGPLAAGEHEDVEQFGAGSGTEGVQPLAERPLDLGQRRHVRTLP